MERYHQVDHTADIAIVAYGADLSEAMVNSAWGMFQVISSAVTVTPVESVPVSVTAPDVESLVVAWLRELLLLHELEGYYFIEFEIQSLSDTALSAVALGERLNEPPADATDLKAVTYHDLRVEEREGQWRIHVTFDI